MTAIPRRTVIITGAVGGMGQAVARLFGATQDLVLTDIAAPALDRFAEDLRFVGYKVSAYAGDLSDEGLLGKLVREIPSGAPFTLVHTAGLSPSLADWRAIMDVNLVATGKLLQAVESILTPGTVAVLIASMAGHMLPSLPDIEAVLADPLQPGFLDKVEAIIEGLGGANSPAGREGTSYVLSKRGVINICERRATEWGVQGARIATISPGMILTPMGRSEMEKTPGAVQLRDNAPVGRIGTSMDIALAAQFIASDAASFITGSDIKVDGGGTAATKWTAGRS